MGASVLGTPTLTQDENAPSFQYSKSRWSTNANASAFGGTYATSSAVGGSAGWTMPAATKLGLRAFRTTNDEISIWQPDGRARVTATMNNLDKAVNGWALSDNQACLQDRIGGQFNNGYFQRVQSSETESIAAGARWAANTIYRPYWR